MINITHRRFESSMRTMRELERIKELVTEQGGDPDKLTFSDCVVLHKRISGVVKYYLNPSKTEEDEKQEEEQQKTLKPKENEK